MSIIVGLHTNTHVRGVRKYYSTRPEAPFQDCASTMPSIDEKISKLRLHPRKYIVLEKGDKDFVSLEDVARVFRLIPEERAKDHGSIDLVAKYLMNQSKLRAFWRMHEYTDDEAMSRLQMVTKAIFVDKPFKGSVIFNAGDDGLLLLRVSRKREYQHRSSAQRIISSGQDTSGWLLWIFGIFKRRKQAYSKSHKFSEHEITSISKVIFH